MVGPGDLVGKYRLVEHLAEGGMGTVWRAHHPELDVDVVVKLVAPEMATPDILRRFEREARAAAKLRSPNIVQVLDYGVTDDTPYLVMELLRGEDLASRLARDGPLPLADCARIVDGVAKAVQLAHDAGIVHRDLKPGNIFLERVGDDEIVKVLDFGIAKDLKAVRDAASTTASVVLGSPAYMSPEQAWGNEVGPKTDLWSLGVVAFEMLTGQNPFFDQKLAQIFHRILREPLPSVRDFAPSLPPALDGFFEHALAREVDARPASASELAARFRAAIEARDGGAEARSAARVSGAATTASGHVAPPFAVGSRFWVVGVGAALLAAAIAFALGRKSDGAAPGEVRDAAVPSVSAVLPIDVGADRTVAHSAVDAAVEVPSASSRPGPAAPSAASARRIALPKPSASAVVGPPPASSVDPTFGIPVRP